MKYKPYPEYKPSGVEWIGDIPVGWEVKKIKWDTPVLRGASPRPIDDPKYFDDEGEYAWVRISDVTNAGKYLEETTEKLSSLGASLSVKLKPGDLFLSIAGSVGKACLTKIKCCIHDGFVYFPRLSANKKYLYWVFASGEAYKGLGKLGTQLNLNTDTVASISIGFPPNNVQQQIANFLDQKTGQIDDLIQKKEKMIKLLKEKRAALINQAVTKGLNPNAKMKPSGIDWIGDIPVGWEKKRIKYISKINTNALPENTDENFEFYYIDIGNVSLEKGFFKGDKIVFSEAPSRARRIVRAGDTIVSTVRTYLKAIAYIDDDENELIASTGFAVVSPGGEIDDGYLYYSLCSGRVVQTISATSYGVSYPAINDSDLASIFLVFPRKEEQEKIVRYLEKKTAELDDLIQKIESAITKLREYRSSIITAAVTGKIDVREVS